MAKKLTNNPLLEAILAAYDDLEFVRLDGLDTAVIGVSPDMKLCYSKAKIIEIIMKRDKMGVDEARDFCEFNIDQLHIGEKTPVIVDDDFTF